MIEGQKKFKTRRKPTLPQEDESRGRKRKSEETETVTSKKVKEEVLVIEDDMILL